MERLTVDYALVGGGLQNALVALCVLARRPTASVLLIEREQLGGNHVWCFHEQDVAPDARAVIAPLVTSSWPTYSVAFPGLQRTVRQTYSAVHCETLRQVIAERFAAAPSAQVLLGTATEVEAHHVRLADGRQISARVVVDARGPDRVMERPIGYQKFLGLELELESDHHLMGPMLMDACVPQTDGMRFFYVLPFSSRRVLVEDTYFSDGPELDRALLTQEILSYAAEAGLRVQSTLRTESGVLPLPDAIRSATPKPGTPLLGGYQGGWFHPTTGYSFPVALRLAQFVAGARPDQLHGAELEALHREHRRQARFAILLNRLLFRACAGQNRRNVLERFYRLPDSTIARFYSLQTTTADRMRIVCGRPPAGVSIARAAIEGLSA